MIPVFAVMPHTVFRIISGTNTEANERNCPDCGHITPAAWPFRFSCCDTGIRVNRVPEVPGKEEKVERICGREHGLRHRGDESM